jgi:pimeloyl-ACP methyl ester carboxylesterase
VPRCSANGIEIEYEITGSAGDDPLLLITGLGAQLVRWDDAFCDALARRGHRVIRFDNRDVGLSSKIDSGGRLRLGEAIAAALRGEPIEAPYRLEDMADDAVALLDALGIESAHVMGTSMGGAIAQVVAIRHPARVRTLTPVMATSGARDLPRPTPEAMRVLLTAAPNDRAGHAEHEVANTRAIGGNGFAFEPERVRRRAEREYDRCFDRAGVARQLLATALQPSRREALRALRIPTLVIHGDEDPLVPLGCGVDIQRCVPGSKLRVIAGMGHELRRGAWPEIIDALCEHTGRPPVGESR